MKISEDFLLKIVAKLDIYFADKDKMDKAEYFAVLNQIVQQEIEKQANKTVVERVKEERDTLANNL